MTNQIASLPIQCYAIYSVYEPWIIISNFEFLNETPLPKHSDSTMS